MSRGRAASFEACINRFEPVIRELSDGFTTDRSVRAHRYFDDEMNVVGYGLYFYAQTFTRVRLPFRECMDFRGWKCPQDRPLRILDIGAGAGAASLGIVAELMERQPSLRLEVTAFDHSKSALEWFRKITRSPQFPWPNHLWLMDSADLRQPARWPVSGQMKWDLIVCSYALNEMMEGRDDSETLEWVKTVLSRLTPDGLLIMTEPALESCSVRLETVRDTLLSAPSGCHVWAPCLHRKPCPLRTEGQYWCHEVRPWKMPPSMEKINRRLFRDNSVIKFSHLVLGNTGPENLLVGGPDVFRMVSPAASMKGKYLMAGCSADGSKNHYELLTRQMDKTACKQVEKLERGQVIQVSPLVPLASGTHYRIERSEDMKVITGELPKI